MTLSGRKVIVAGLFSAREPAPDAALLALARCVEARGGVVVGRILQRRGVSRSRRPGGSKKMDEPLSAATLLGSGKVRELAELCRATEAEVVILRNPLSETQVRNLEAACGVTVHAAARLGLPG